MNKYNQIIRTEIGWNFIEGSSISIVGETSKAYLMIVSIPVRRGTSSISDVKEREQWVPKSVWDKDSNFKEDTVEGSTMINFVPPFFMR